MAGVLPGGPFEAPTSGGPLALLCACHLSNTLRLGYDTSLVTALFATEPPCQRFIHVLEDHSDYTGEMCKVIYPFKGSGGRAPGSAPCTGMYADTLTRMEKLFTAYFRRNDRANGNTALRVPDDGTYPEFIAWEGQTYRLWDADHDAGEAHYEWYATA